MHFDTKPKIEEAAMLGCQTKEEMRIETVLSQKE